VRSASTVRRNKEADTVNEANAAKLLDQSSGVLRYVKQRKYRCGLPQLSNESLFAIGLVTTALQGGGLIFGFTAFQQAILDKEGSGFKLADVGLIFMIGHNITVFASAIAGFFCDAYGPRLCAVTGLLIEAAGHGLMLTVGKNIDTSYYKMLIYIGFGLIGLGGCQVLLAALKFCGAFQNQGLISSLMTVAFQAGGFVFMLLPYVEWDMFFQVYAASCVASALFTAMVYPDNELVADTADGNQVVSEVANLAGAIVQERTLKQLLFRKGTIWFLLTFAIVGSAYCYGFSAFPLSLQVQDECDWNEHREQFENCTHQEVQNGYNNLWMPLIGNLNLPAALAMGWLIDKRGFAPAAFIMVSSVQLLIVAIMFCPLQAAVVVVFIYNIANTAVFAMQNAYVCMVGGKHIGALFAVSNAMIGVGNFAADWMIGNPFGEGDSQIKTSLIGSGIIWLILCTPCYWWTYVEYGRRQKAKTGYESFHLQASNIDSHGSWASSMRSRKEERRSQQSGSNGVRGSNKGSKGIRGQMAEPLAVAPCDADRKTSSAPPPPPSVLSNSPNTVLTVHQHNWEDKLQKTIEAGADNIFCVFDFDRTITRCFLENGERSLDCHDILASIPKITEQCKQYMEEMMDYYYPIEISANMSAEEKIPHMVEWYTKVNFLLADQCLNRDDVVTAVAGCHNFRIRAGVTEAFQILAAKNIPVIILSAGLGNVIEEVVRQRIPKINGVYGEAWPNVKVLSNTMLWDDEGEFMEFSTPLIHMFNKSLADAPADIKSMIEGRGKCILCGDGLGDLTMDHGSNATDTLRFGFLNEKIEQRMPKYIEPNAFDRIILNDGDWSTVLEDVINKL
jgi:5'-nucleotidase